VSDFDALCRAVVALGIINVLTLIISCYIRAALACGQQ
jgi:hypothetical protein